MLANTKMHAILTHKNHPNLVHLPLEMYYAYGKPIMRVEAEQKIAISDDQLLLTGLSFTPLGYDRTPIDSVRMLHGHVLGLYLPGGNEAGISRVTFYGEDATFTMQLRSDGSLEESSWHHVEPYWDFPSYQAPDGTRFREPMYDNIAWTSTPPAWGFTKYSWEETH